jgi:hypothetical protein
MSRSVLWDGLIQREMRRRSIGDFGGRSPCEMDRFPKYFYTDAMFVWTVRHVAPTALLQSQFRLNDLRQSDELR